MKKFITNQPGKQTVRKIKKPMKRTLYKPYGKGSTSPVGQVPAP
jgi:hypothetical protein